MEGFGNPAFENRPANNSSGGGFGGETGNPTIDKVADSDTAVRFFRLLLKDESLPLGTQAEFEDRQLSGGQKKS